MSPARPVAVLALSASVLLAGCGSDAPQAAAGPVTVPDGYVEASCGLPPLDPRTTVTLALPRTADRDEDLGEVEANDEKTCEWLLPATRTRFFDGIRMVLAHADTLEQETLSDLHDELEPRVGLYGDEQVWDLELAEDVPVFGVTGDRLTWRCACNGVGGTYVEAQVGDVRVTFEGADDNVLEIGSYADRIVPLVRVGG